LDNAPPAPPPEPARHNTAGETLAITPELLATIRGGCRRQVAGAPHLTLPELEKAVRERQAWSGYWEMPAHLATCPICLELFNSLLQGVPPAPPAAIARFTQLQAARHRRFRLLPAPATLAKAAAAVLLLGAALWTALHLLGAAPLTVVAGTVASAGSGSEFTTGTHIPGQDAMLALRDTIARFPDGSRLSLASGTQFRIAANRLRGETIHLDEGSVECEVAPHRHGRQFQVATAAGVVTVVGTRFTVTSRSDPATRAGDLPLLHPARIGQGTAIANATVTVKVAAGRVRIQNPFGHLVEAGPGQTAVLQNNLRVIDLFESR
jgi:hypothetical protein